MTTGMFRHWSEPSGGQQLQPVHLGHVDIGEDQGGLMDLEDFERLLAVPGFMDRPDAMPVWRNTRCRIFRMAAESSTTKTSGSIGTPYKVFIGASAVFH